MKIKAEVLSVETIGDALSLLLQGKATTDADWRPHLRLRLQVPETKTNRRAFYVGRKVSVTVSAE